MNVNGQVQDQIASPPPRVKEHQGPTGQEARWAPLLACTKETYTIKKTPLTNMT
jgi:hypothetical protein